MSEHRHAWVCGACGESMPQHGNAGMQRGKGKKLTAADITEIRWRYEHGEHQTAIAEQFGVSQPTVHHIVSGKTWRAA